MSGCVNFRNAEVLHLWWECNKNVLVCVCVYIELVCSLIVGVTHARGISSAVGVHALSLTAFPLSAGRCDGGYLQ